MAENQILAEASLAVMSISAHWLMTFHRHQYFLQGAECRTNGVALREWLLFEKLYEYFSFCGETICRPPVGLCVLHCFRGSLPLFPCFPQRYSDEAAVAVGHFHLINCQTVIRPGSPSFYHTTLSSADNIRLLAATPIFYFFWIFCDNISFDY